MALTLRTRRRLLCLSTFLLVIASVSLAGLAITAQQSSDASTLGPFEAVRADRLPYAVENDQVVDPESPAWRVRLRRPLFDPPPPPPREVVKKKLPPIRAKLLGTIIEPGASRAMIGLPGGAVEFRGKGEPLGPQDPEAVIEAIGPESIRVARGEETTELTIDRGY